MSAGVATVDGSIRAGDIVIAGSTSIGVLRPDFTTRFNIQLTGPDSISYPTGLTTSANG